PDSGDKVVWFENDGTDLSFTEHLIGSANGLIHGAPIDMDGDGDWDIVAAAYSEGKIYWYANNGSQSFTRYTVDASINGPSKVYPVDLDEDGDMDIVGNSITEFRWYENDGSENFTEHVITAQVYISGIEVVDLDADGDLDLVSGKSTVYWYQNDGSENFTEISACTGTPGVSDMDVVDMDGDGDYDIVSVYWTNAAGVDLHWCENDGSENFTYSAVDTSLSYARTVATGDLDGDGDLDIISGDANMYWYGVTLSNPTVSTLSPTDNSTGATLATNLVITFDQVIASTGTGYVTIYKSSDDSIIEQISTQTGAVTGSGTTTMTINPSSNLEDLTDYYIKVDSNAFPNSSGLSYLGISDTTTWNFTTGDETAPTLSAVSASTGTGSATIIWTTNESGSTLVQYGTTSTFGFLSAETDISTRVKSHSVTLSNLTACTNYFYSPISKDSSWNTTTGSTVNFTTTGCTSSADVLSQTGGTITTSSTGSLSLVNNGSGAALSVPQNSTTNTFTLQIKKIDSDTVIASTSTPTNKSVIGDHTYDFRAISGSTLVTSFDEAITVTMTYTDAQVSGYTESSLRIYRWDGSSWNQLSNCAVDTTANTVTCTTTNFSTFGLFGSAVSTTSTTSTDVSTVGGGHRGSKENMAKRIALAHASIIARYEGKQQQQTIAINNEPEELEVPDKSASSEERHIYRAAQKVKLHASAFKPILEHRGFLVTLVGGTTVLYRDVPSKVWFAPYVSSLIEENIAQGYKDETGKLTGEFGVKNPVTYAEVLKMALNTAEENISGLRPPRNLSAKGTWTSAYVAKAEDLGLSVFNSNLNVHTAASRGEVIQIILEIMKIPTRIKIDSPFVDVSERHPYTPSIATAAAYGIINGDTDLEGNELKTFRPDEQINRAEVAKIIALVLEAVK
ncbi:MAG: VCBS repeat-containing protein, partial [Candidatus Peribacteraceae bacterium]|nr:VCBS repeat-containing protein [Candidatus Peribacteraceae bacterium]